MSPAFPSDERCLDLLIQQATTGLDAAEAAELAQLLARFPGTDRGAFEPAVAALTLAARRPAEPLPDGLRARLLAQAPAATPVADLAAARRARAAAPGRAGRAGWWAAAAAVLVAVAGWYPRLAGPPPAPTAAERRAQLLAASPGAVHWEFAATDDPGGAGAGGDVVFDPATQQGYLRLHLKANDPRRSQYQLWIFDGERDDRFPVDGGVFDVPAGVDEIVVPITARVRVTRPALFAVTVERPGGVVVSGREHIVVLAKPGRA